MGHYDSCREYDEERRRNPKKSQPEKSENDNQNDMVSSPKHYTVGGYEAIDVIQAKLTKEQFIGYCLGNALKYNMRFNYKGNRAQDAGKADWYIRRLLKVLTPDEE